MTDSSPPDLREPGESWAEREVAHAVVKRQAEGAVVAGVLALHEQEVVEPIIEALSRLDSVATSTPAALRSSKRLKALTDKITDIGKDAVKSFKSGILVELEDWSQTEIDFLLRSGQDILTVDLGRPSKGLVKQLMKDEPVLGKPMDEWIKGAPQATAKNVVTRVRRGLAAGESSSQIIRAIRGTRSSKGIMDISRRQVQALMTTLLTHSSAMARQATFDENSTVVEKVQFLAVLDGRTTITCASLDGEIFPADALHSRPPLHIGCRSTVVPYFGKPRGQRAALGGPVDAKVSFEKWLKTQDDKIVESVLGKTRAAAWRSGKLTLDQMVEGAIRKVTPVAELKAKGLL